MDRVAEEMPADLYARWAAFAEVEPFGEVRQDARFDLIAQLIRAALFDMKGKKPEPFFETLKTEEGPETPEEIQRRFELWVLSQPNVVVVGPEGK